ncbi:MAG: response regulator transcription factor [Anaerolineae bacterium]|nr:response regulator transcription factor [Promineifilum sp.]MCZ2114985.1 response regulator transcription factor [Anaerolineae bacterium]HNS39022.1 response regulator transcription factor [Promineifilum sp.]
MSSTILVVEDEERIRQFLQRGLGFEGYRVQAAADGPTALELARENPPDLVLLDLMLPGMDGLEVCRRLRAVSDVPILMLTAKEAIDDRVAGLDAGADDYLVKPFAFDELMARVRALLRRAQPAQPQIFRFADLELDTGTRQGRRDGVTFDLTAKEYELLELFMRHPRQVLTRDVIFDHVWNYDFGGESNIIEVYVRYLRQKTEQGDMSRLIHTVRGIGYVLREEQ